ncbi:hypothetical protein FFLO_06406 [Filobasidium floriforme]|uniref:Uncharacterized protein n=1 Tax=Filobasidium floriforme TaxID=5210 RepID=A0A8K0JGV0_9TREE|nr:uncharacterized protein HD553DRAFT_66731 [Filobasidium floriforme]KAG7528114.1 hypothetical protein FFLO_06406 [Filobasidium floriforme]KAH8082787.1 hypothetical protein HD553DRAFT_66731 [Filobasidium floriforme]
MFKSGWSDDEPNDVEVRSRMSYEDDRGVDFMRSSNLQEEGEESQVYIALYGRLEKTDTGAEGSKQTSAGRKPGKQDQSRVPRRRCSAEIDWTAGQRSRAMLTPRHRLELADAVQAYDTAYTQFARMYRAMHETPPYQYPLPHATGLGGWRFVPEIEHVHVAYTAMMQSYVRLCVMERQYWDEKSVCLEVDGLYSAYRTFLGSAFRGVAGWPVDFDARLPTMDGYYEGLERQYRLKAYGETLGQWQEEEEDVEEVSDFEDALACANEEVPTVRGETTKKTARRPSNARRKSSRRLLAGVQDGQPGRRRAM